MRTQGTRFKRHVAIMTLRFDYVLEKVHANGPAGGALPAMLKGRSQPSPELYLRMRHLARIGMPSSPLCNSEAALCEAMFSQLAEQGLSCRV
jgi:hypothetical protein